MKVAMVIFDGVQAFEVAGSLDVFAPAYAVLAEIRKSDVSLVIRIEEEGGQSQYSAYIGAGRVGDPVIGKVRGYVVEHMSEALSMDELASVVAVSRRTLSRLFAKHAKVPPWVFVEQLRVDTARKLLDESDTPLKTIAFARLSQRPAYARDFLAIPRYDAQAVSAMNPWSST